MKFAGRPGGRGVQRPLFTVLLMLVIVADVLLVRRAVRRTDVFGPASSGLSLIGAEIKIRNSHDSVYFVIEPTNELGLRVLDLDANSADELVRRMTGDPESLVRGQFVVLRTRWGVVTPWTLRTLHRLRVESVARPNSPTPPSAELQSQVREALARHLEWTGWRQDAALLRSGDADTTGVVVPGVIHDALLVLLLGLWVYSLRWVRRWFDRTGRALAQGRCPKCGYDLLAVKPRGGERGSGRVKQCPECGSWWESDVGVLRQGDAERG
jgi:hypothetical protein